MTKTFFRMRNVATMVACLAATMTFATSCGGNASKKQSEAAKTETAAPQAAKMDLSRFTPVEVTPSDLIKEWMIPDFGVITGFGELVPGGTTHTMTVCGVTKSDVENYKKHLVAQGMVRVPGFAYENSTTEIIFADQAVEKTSTSELRLTFNKAKPKK